MDSDSDNVGAASQGVPSPSRPPQEIIDALEQDLCVDGNPNRSSRRLVLVSHIPGASAHSVQDRSMGRESGSTPSVNQIGSLPMEVVSEQPVLAGADPRDELTQWESGAEVSMPTRPSEFWSQEPIMVDMTAEDSGREDDTALDTEDHVEASLWRSDSSAEPILPAEQVHEDISDDAHSSGGEEELESPRVASLEPVAPMMGPVKLRSEISIMLI